MLKKYFIPFSVLLLTAATLGCNPDSGTDQSHKSTAYHKLRFDYEEGICGNDSMPGLRFSTSYVVPSDSSAGGRNIADFIENFIVRNIHANTDSTFIGIRPSSGNRIKDAYEDLKDAYLDFRKSFPDAMGCWEIEMNGDSIFTSPKVISYGLAQYSFLGGAHPNTFTTFYLFDAHSGKELNPIRFFSDSTAFLNIVESRFRRVEKLSAADNLEEKGYFLQNGKFFLPANYIFSDKGVLIHYNPYEIAPYVKGPISFTIPYKELKGNLKEELLF